MRHGYILEEREGSTSLAAANNNTEGSNANNQGYWDKKASLTEKVLQVILIMLNQMMESMLHQLCVQDHSVPSSSPRSVRLPCPGHPPSRLIP